MVGRKTGIRSVAQEEASILFDYDIKIRAELGVFECSESKFYSFDSVLRIDSNRIGKRIDSNRESPSPTRQ